MSDRIAIIGMAGVFPHAADLNAYWHNIINKVDTITDVPPTHWQAEDYFSSDPSKADHVYTTKGGFLPSLSFDPREFGIAPRNLSAIDTAQLLGLLVARNALYDAGYGTERDFDRNRTNVIFGATGAQELVIPLGARLGHPHWRHALRKAGIADDIAERIVTDIANSYVSWQEASFPGLLGNVIAGRIANRFDLRGTNCAVDAACASSLAALRLACLELQSHSCDMAVCGGVDTFNDIFMYMCFARTQALAPDGKAKAYDRRANGTTLGEGAGALILKRYDDAVAAADHIYATIYNIGSASDGRGHAIYEPSSAGQALALRAACRGIDPTSITLLEGHGTGTRVGDHIELQALHEVFRHRDKKKWCALGSVKSQIGHTKAAAGIAGIIKAALALHHKVLPPTINCAEPHPLLADSNSPFYLNTESCAWEANQQQPRRAGVSSFGFGGSNFHCVLEESPVRNSRPPRVTPTNTRADSFTITINGANIKDVDLSAITADNSRHGNYIHGNTMPEAQPADSTTNATTKPDAVTQAAIAAVQQIQARSADLHAKFLDSQSTSLQTLTNIVNQRQPGVEADSLSSVSEAVPQLTSVPTTEEPIPVVHEDTATTSTQLNGHDTDVGANKQQEGSEANGHDDLRTSLLTVVAQKTGYPEDMITLDMKIEEDLGIDSIKRVEILSALKDKHPQLETADDQLVTATSLHDILNFCQTEKKKLTSPPPYRFLAPLTLNTNTFPLLQDHMLNERIVMPAALALMQLRRFAEHITSHPQQHLSAFRVLRGVTFPPADTVQLTPHAQDTPDACRVSLHKDEHVCYQALAMHDATPPMVSTRLPTCPLHNNDDVYANILFHGERLQLLTKISAPHQQHSSASFVIPEDIDHETAAIDAALQLAIVHIQRRYKAFSLPAAIGSYRLFSTPLPSQGTITVRMTAPPQCPCATRC